MAKGFGKKVEDLGFHFHSMDGVYWDERACYHFTAAEIEENPRAASAKLRAVERTKAGPVDRKTT